MQIVRTTIRLPEKLHKELKHEAVRKGKSLNELLIGKLRDKKTTNRVNEVQKRTKVLNSIKELRKKIDTKGITPEEIIEYINDGRKY